MFEISQLFLELQYTQNMNFIFNCLQDFFQLFVLGNAFYKGTLVKEQVI